MLRKFESQALGKAVEEAFDELDIEPPSRQLIESALEPLKLHHEPTYLHCLRVGLSSLKIAQHQNLTRREQQLVFTAGLIHDCGKARTPLSVLECIGHWTRENQRIVKKHVIDGYNMVFRTMPFAGAIMLWHHKFQPGAYPRTFPRSALRYCDETRKSIRYYGRLLALADFYDAAHRKNERSGDVKRSDAEIKVMMLKANADEEQLVQALYDHGIFVG